MNSPMPPMTADPRPIDASLITYTNIIYALHALAVVVGLSTAHTIVGSFVGGLPSIIAVIMNYVRRSATRGTFLFALLWSIVIVLVSAPFMLILIGFAFAWVGLVALGIWIAYRVIRGWLALRDRRPMYV